jgi:transcriptional regulator with XRE-family HTH domain
LSYNERLKFLRKGSNKTQKEISIAVNISERNYRRLEKGDVSPVIDTIIALSKYFGVSLDYLVGRTDNPAVNE